jgi:hypothetical protein
LSPYKVSRGTIQFPLDKRLPLTLVSRIVKFRVRENLARHKRKAAREKLARLRFDRAAARAFGAWTEAAHPDLVTDVDLARYRERLRGTTNRRLRTRIRHG